MNPHTMAAVIGQNLVLNSVVSELVALLTSEQRSLLRERLTEHAREISPIDEFEPECSEYRAARFSEWIDALAPKP